MTLPDNSESTPCDRLAPENTESTGRSNRRLPRNSCGYRALSNHGADAHQEVPHYHVHILAGRGLGRIVPKAADE